MIKKITNCFMLSSALLSLNQVLAEDFQQPGTVFEEVNQIKEEVNGASEKLLQSYLNDAEITGKKKEIGVRVLNQAKIKDADVQKFLDDTEISEDQKVKLLKKFKKFVGEAKTACGKKSEEKVSAESETSADLE